MCSLLGDFLCEIFQYASACQLQERALMIDHNLFDNMSRRVAESTTALAKTKHLQVPHTCRAALTTAAGQRTAPALPPNR